jgi:hypothetical protein
MEIFNYHEERPSNGHCSKPTDQNSDSFLLALLRTHACDRLLPRLRNRQQSGQKGEHELSLQAAHRQLVFEFSQLLLGRVRRYQVGGPFDLLDERVQGSVAMVGRALETDGFVGIVAEPLIKGLYNPGLADSGLAGYQNDLSRAAPRQLPALHEFLKRVRSPYEGR